jgi:hypothetical protein
MGQGLGCGAAAGVMASLAAGPLRTSLANHVAIAAAGAGAGLCVDLVSDINAKTGKVLVHRDVVLQASDVLRHVYTFYAPCESNLISRRFYQKHEWCVLESHTNRFYTVQKWPKTGDVSVDMRMSLRTANDLGLVAAGRPTMTGETKLARPDCDFDLPNDLQVAYIIAWLRKEDPRWAFSTENSRHFTTRLRSALNDF